MININNFIYIDILIDGKPIPTSPNMVSKIVMAEGNSAIAPSVNLVLNDYVGNLEQSLCLTDGNSIIITAGISPSDVKTVTRQYRLFGMRQHALAQGPQIDLVAVYDAPNFISASARESYVGCSSEVLKSIAATCKLSYTGPEYYNNKIPIDKQTWLNVGKNRALFSQLVARHGIIDEHSCMATAVTSLGELRYRNLTDCLNVDASTITRYFLHNAQQSSKDKVVYNVIQAMNRSNAGLSNTWQNYGSIRIDQKLSGVVDALAKVAVSTKANFLPINDQVAKTIAPAKIAYAALDCGNTHDLYQQAYYQNIRLMSLFSERMSILVYQPTDVQLFDTVIYRQAKANDNQPYKDSDVYVIVGKTIQITNCKSYAERIELAKIGLTVGGASMLKTQDPVSAALAAIPISKISPVLSNASKLITTAKNITSLLQSPLNYANSLGSLSSMVTQGITQAIPLVTNVLGISSNLNLVNPNSILSILPSPTSLYNLNSVLSSINGTVASMSTNQLGLNSALTSLNSGLSGVSSIVRQASMFVPGGIFNQFSTQFSSINQLTNLTNVTGLLTSTLSTMNYGSVGNDAALALSTLTSTHNLLTGLLGNQNTLLTGSWNNILSTTTANPIGTPVISASTLYNSSVANSVTVNPSMFAEQLKNNMLTIQGNQNMWLSPNTKYSLSNTNLLTGMKNLQASNTATSNYADSLIW